MRGRDGLLVLGGIAIGLALERGLPGGLYPWWVWLIVAAFQFGAYAMTTLAPPPDRP